MSEISFQLFSLYCRYSHIFRSRLVFVFFPQKGYVPYTGKYTEHHSYQEHCLHSRYPNSSGPRLLKAVLSY